MEVSVLDDINISFIFSASVHFGTQILW